MVIGHHAHDPGITSLHGGRLWVVDPGMSAAVMDGTPRVLVIRPEESGPGLVFQRVVFRPG
jgi:hypothetical protein